MISRLTSSTSAFSRAASQKLKTPPSPASRVKALEKITLPFIEKLTLRKAQDIYASKDLDTPVDSWRNELAKFLEPILKKHYGIDEKTAQNIAFYTGGSLVDEYCSLSNSPIKTHDILIGLSGYLDKGLERYKNNNNEVKTNNTDDTPFLNELVNAVIHSRKSFKPESLQYQITVLAGKLAQISAIESTIQHDYFRLVHDENKGELRSVPFDKKKFDELTKQQKAEYEGFYETKEKRIQEIKENVAKIKKQIAIKKSYKEESL